MHTNEGSSAMSSFQNFLHLPLKQSFLFYVQVAGPAPPGLMFEDGDFLWDLVTQVDVRTLQLRCQDSCSPHSANTVEKRQFVR